MKDIILKKRLNLLAHTDPDKYDQLTKSMIDQEDVLEKGRGLPVGTIRTHGGKKVKKTVDGWAPVKGDKKNSSDEDKDSISQELKEVNAEIKQLENENAEGFAKEIKNLKTRRFALSQMAKTESKSSSNKEKESKKKDNKKPSLNSKAKVKLIAETLGPLTSKQKQEKLLELGLSQEAVNNLSAVHPSIWKDKFIDQVSDLMNKEKDSSSKKNDVVMTQSLLERKVRGLYERSPEGFDKWADELMKNPPEYIKKHMTSLDEMGEDGKEGLELALAKVEMSNKKPSSDNKSKKDNSSKQNTDLSSTKSIYDKYGITKHADEVNDSDFSSQMSIEDHTDLISSIVEEGNLSKTKGAQALSELGVKTADIARSLNMHYSHAHSSVKKIDGGNKVKQIDSPSKLSDQQKFDSKDIGTQKSTEKKQSSKKQKPTKSSIQNIIKDDLKKIESYLHQQAVDQINSINKRTSKSAQRTLPQKQNYDATIESIDHSNKTINLRVDYISEPKDRFDISAQQAIRDGRDAPYQQWEKWVDMMDNLQTNLESKTGYKVEW